MNSDFEEMRERQQYKCGVTGSPLALARIRPNSWTVSAIFLLIVLFGDHLTTRHDATGAQSGGNDGILRHSKIIVGENGQNARVEITGSRITMINENGKASVMIAYARGDVSLKLFNDQGRPEIGLSVVKDGETCLSLGDENPSLSRITNNGFTLFQSGKRRVEMSSSDDYPRIMLRDKKGTTRAALGFLEQSDVKSSIPELTLFDENAKGRVSLGGTVAAADQKIGGKEGLSWLLLRDANDKIVWKAP